MTGLVSQSHFTIF